MRGSGPRWDGEGVTARNVPTHQEPEPEEDPAGHGQGRAPTLRQRQDDPETDVDDPAEDVDDLGEGRVRRAPPVWMSPLLLAVSHPNATITPW